MKTTLDLPEELVREAKLRALMQGRTLRDLVSDMLRQGLGMAPAVAEPASSTPERASRVGKSPTGLPIIPCHGDAAASHMAVPELLQLEQQALTADDARYAGRTV